MKDHKYTISFSSVIKPVVSEDKDKYLALASQLSVGDFIPDIDTDKNIDLLPIAFDAFVANRVNKNGDVVNGETAMEIYSNFINKPINIEHNRDKVIGTILTAGFSEFGTGKTLTAEEVKDMNGPYNITLGGVIWKVVNDKVASIIEESADPDSDHYKSVSASWELGFSEYDIAAIAGESKNLEDAEILAEESEIKEFEPKLRGFGGEGSLDDGRKIYRRVKGKVVPLGIGLTENPAAEVEGVHTNTLKQKNIEEKEEKISQSDEQVVMKHTRVAMKIKKLEDIKEENMERIDASNVSDFIEEQLQEASEKFAEQKVAHEKALSEATEKHESLVSEHEQLKAEFEKIASALAEIEAEQAAKAAEELFNQRMGLMDEEFVLEDAERELIASDIKDLDEEAFDSYLGKMKVLMKTKTSDFVKAEEEKAAAEQAEVEANTPEPVPNGAAPGAPAAEAEEAPAEEVVEDAVDNAEEEDSDIPNTTEASEPTIYEKYKNAFSYDQFEIK